MQRSTTRRAKTGAGSRLLLLLVASLVLLVVCLAFAAGGPAPAPVSAATHATGWPTPLPTSTGVLLWDNRNVYTVYNGATSPVLEINTDVYITEIWTYHWNNGHGAQPGSIGLRTDFGYVFGPWPASSTPGQGGVSNANWVARPNQVIPAGTYTIVDSDPETWSQNESSHNLGMTWAYGMPDYTPSPSPSPTPTKTPTPTTSPTPTTTPTPTQSPTPTSSPTPTPTPTGTPTPAPTVDTATGWETQPSGTSATLHGVASVDPTHSWAVGDGGTIVVTSNGGQTWTPQSSGTTAGLNDVFFLGSGSSAQARGATSSRGWAVGKNGTILATSSAGATWTKQASGTTAELNAVTFTDSQRGYAVGSGGTILATMNGGTTWTTRPSPSTVVLKDVTFADGMRGWAVGSGGTVLSTENAGATWAPQTSGSSTQLNSVSFADATRGWAAGSGGTILSTTNGGGSWSALRPNTSADLSGITFADGLRGWAVGSMGSVLTTLNGGNTWSIQQLFSGGSFLGLVFPTATRGWLVGQGGLIVVTNSGGLPLAPAIASIKPASARRGAVVTVSGANFGVLQGLGYVRFGSAKCAKYLIWTPTKIICRVPGGARYGKVKVTVTTPLGKSNAKSFKVKR